MPKTKTKPVEVEDDDVELEELDASVEETPAKEKKAGRADDPAFGIRQLCDYIKSKTGKEYQPREMRTLLRKMAREDTARITREVTADNRSRYSWSGPADAEVKAVLAAVKGGEIEAGKKEALDKLKADKAARDAAKAELVDTATTVATKAKKKKAAAPPVDEDDDDDDIELDDDDD